MKRKKAWIELILTQGLGVGTAYKLIQKFGEPCNFPDFESEIGDILTSAVAHNLKNKALNKNNFTVDEILEVLDKQNIRMITILDEEYPKILRNIKSPPIVLFVKGILPNDKSFAIVGTRKLSDYGKSVTQKLSREVAAAGFTIISGLAMGADAIAHTSAIIEKTPTVAVLGPSVDTIYPTVNTGLAKKILDTGGCLISENPPGTVGAPWLFPARNRIIAGLSKGVLITEGERTSGALITYKFGLEQGKNIYAVPGDINRVQAQGPNFLISKGAKLVTCGQDILEDYGYLPSTPRDEDKKIEFEDPKQEKIYNLICKSPKISVDNLLVETGFNHGEMSYILMQLEFKNYIKKLSGGMYCKS